MNQSIVPNKRIYIEGKLDNNIVVEDKLYNYLKNVLKLNKNEYIYVLNSMNIATYKILDVKKGKIILEKNSERLLKGGPYNLTIYQAVLKREYMDNILEKSGELGVTKFIPVYTQRCNSRRWRRFWVSRGGSAGRRCCRRPPSATCCWWSSFC